MNMINIHFVQLVEIEATGQPATRRLFAHSQLEV